MSLQGLALMVCGGHAGKMGAMSKSCVRKVDAMNRLSTLSPRGKEVLTEIAQSVCKGKVT